ncbi:MAG: ATP-grasp domain-containing protein [Candidatus Odinarchaeia archaeon]
MVYEHASGGGYCNKVITPSIFSEGYAMLNATVQDFQRIENKVYTTLDYRIANFVPPLKVEIVTVLRPGQDIFDIFDSVCKEVDQILIIAPENNDILYRLTRIAENNQIIILGSTSESIKLVSNKWNVQLIAKNCDLTVPNTVKVNFETSIDELREILKNTGYPAIFRNLDSVGSSGVFYITKKSDLNSIIAKMKETTNYNEFLIHKYIKGISVSVSLISNGINSQALSLNAQVVNFDKKQGEMNYIGGYVPLKYKLSRTIKKQAATLIENISGLRGYLGVDLVLSEDDKIYFLEVNPRITTSYVALRKIVDFNLAEIIKKAILEGELPKPTKFKGVAFFSKVIVPNADNLPITKTRDLALTGGIIAPPFPTGLNLSEALIVSEGKSLKEAQNAFEYMKKSVENLAK